jgi:protein-S-isoprenylcysteine O-methyltransferase Ste14
MNASASANKPSDQSKITRGVVRWLVRETMGTAILIAILFLCAGHWDWVWGWTLVIVTVLWIGGTAVTVIPRNPELLAERVGPRKGTKTWDTAILGAYGLVGIVRYIVAGLDVRYEWTTGFSAALQIIALIVTALGYGLIVWATAANAFFSQVVRIQTERGHTTITDGPYQFVRHPAYVGIILVELGMPLMLGSWWALVPSVLSVPLFFIRTALEDKTLQSELPGYKEYAAQVRYRLVPGIW